MSPIARGILIALLASVVLAIKKFARKQNHAHGLGGRIAGAKQFWLGFAVFCWFLFPLPLLAEGFFPAPLGIVIGTFVASMWARGLIELFLLYGPKLWRPPMGIGHDVFCLVVIVAQLGFYAQELPGPQSPRALFAYAFLSIVVVSLVVEIIHAATFLKAVEGRTVGDDGIWFADEEEAKFQAILKRTRTFNLILGGALLILLILVLVPGILVSG